MNEHFEKFKTHIKDHKELYIGLGIGLGVAGITYVIMRRTSSRCIHSALTEAVVSTPPSQVTSHSFNSNSFNTTYNYRAKRLSYIVSQDGTDNWWRSQREAAKACDISAVNLSKHLNHGEPIVGRPELSFTRQGVSS